MASCLSRLLLRQDYKYFQKNSFYSVYPLYLFVLTLFFQPDSTAETPISSERVPGSQSLRDLATGSFWLMSIGISIGTNSPLVLKRPPTALYQKLKHCSGQACRGSAVAAPQTWERGRGQDGTSVCSGPLSHVQVPQPLRALLGHSKESNGDHLL